MNFSLPFQSPLPVPKPAPCSFSDKVLTVRNEPLAASGIDTLQVNLGYRCNMACTHCHVSAGPGRTESMGRETIDALIRVLRQNPIRTLDITGGAPELNPDFHFLVTQAKEAGKRVIVRTNLTVFFEPGMADLPGFFRDQGVELIASLPCYLEQNVNAARGNGAFVKSIEALRKLNELGYGIDGVMSLPLGLVYNPAGAFLPPRQADLEVNYKRELKTRYGISFTRLYVFTNMPIGRFRDALLRTNDLEKYMGMLVTDFNPANLNNLMCRTLLNIGWDGRLYDCDFNQVAGTAVTLPEKREITDFDFQALSKRRIAISDHCYACTAGQGST